MAPAAGVVGHMPSIREAVVWSAVVWYFAGRMLGDVSFRWVGPVCLVVYVTLYLSGALVEDVTIAAFHTALFACISLSERRRVAFLCMSLAIGLVLIWKVWAGAAVLCLAFGWLFRSDPPVQLSPKTVRAIYWIGSIGLIAMILSLVPLNGFESRVQIWGDALSEFLSHPWTGSGVGRMFLRGDRLIGFSHNAFITILVELGVLGLAPIACMMWGIVTSWRSYPAWVQASVICFGVWSLVDEPFYWLGPAVILAFLLGHFGRVGQTLVIQKLGVSGDANDS